MGKEKGEILKNQQRWGDRRLESNIYFYFSKGELMCIFTEKGIDITYFAIVLILKY